MEDYVYRKIAVTDLPKSVPKFIEKANSIHDSMHGSTFFTGLTTEIGALLTATNTLDVTQKKFKKTPAEATREARDGDDFAARSAVEVLRLGVQLIADADPEHAAEIIVAAGMRVKEVKTRVPRTPGACCGPVSGSAFVWGGSGPHNFEMSTDNVHWTALPGSRKGKIYITGYTPGVFYFRSAPILTHDKIAPWSQSFKLTIV